MIVADFRYKPFSATDKDLKEATCIGPNGQSINFVGRGYSDYKKAFGAYMWLKEKSDTFSQKVARILYYKNEVVGSFSGYKLPVRPVKQQ